MNKINKTCRQWYDKSYSRLGFMAQRLYPNEELLRFMGTNFFSKVDFLKRKNIKVLEMGCGSCSNLWMIAKEGFDSYGIDISKKAIELGGAMLDRWGVKADLTVGDMIKLPYRDNFFNVVVDVFSAYCLDLKKFDSCLNEMKRVLKTGGIFFSYAPSINSDAFKNYKPAKKIDIHTLNGIKRKGSPYFGNNYPFRFTDPLQYKKILEEKGFKISYLETVSRTYHYMNEIFEFVVIVGKKY